MNALYCRCGTRIHEEDVLQQEYYLRPFGSHLVYLKFRCPGCGKLSEQFIRQSEWSETALLPEKADELSEKQKQIFAAMGPITAKEASESHFRLKEENPLASLNALKENDSKR